MPRQTIDAALCRNCGLCVRVCKSGVYAAGEPTPVLAPDPGPCLGCGQCVAVCPTAAIAVAGVAPGGTAEAASGPAELLALMRRRRSIRLYKPDPVARELLEQLVEAAKAAPMCFPPSLVECTVLASREQVAPLAPALVKQLRQLRRMIGSAFGRFLLRRLAGRQAFQLIMEHLAPMMGPWLDQPEADGEDFCTWGAPALLLFHQDKHTSTGETDCLLACTQAMLMAEALGLGAVQLGFAAMAVERDPELRQCFGIPADNTIHATLAVGWPAVSFARTLDRQLKSVRWV